MTKAILSEPDYKAIFQGGQVLYLIVAPDVPKYTILGASNAYLQATKRTLENLVGLGIFEAFPENPDDSGSQGEANVRSSINRVRESGLADVMPIQKYDIPRAASEGGGFEVKYWSPVHFPVFDENRTLIHIVQRVEDVTDLVKLQQLGTEQSKVNEELQKKTRQMEVEVVMRAQEVKGLYEKLKDLDKLKTAFFANISHELRTPLTIIFGYTRELKKLFCDQPQVLKKLISMEKNADTLLKLVNDILDLTKSEAGAIEVNLTCFDLDRLMAAYLDGFQTLAKEKNISLVSEIGTNLEAILDQDKIERIAINLISNAVKFTPKGGKILVRLEARNDRLRLEVSDSGPGIPPEQADHIFDRFVRLADSTHSVGGTGLGLAIVKQFVELLKGKVFVMKSSLGGACFSVDMPLKLASFAPRSKSEAIDLAFVPLVESPTTKVSVKPSAATHQDRPRILVAEDHAELRAFLQGVLEEDFRVFLAEDGQVALDILENQAVDIIISDMMMPRLDGAELFARVREDARFQSTPFVFLTAKEDQSLKMELLEKGAQDFLAKPFQTEELKSKIMSHVYLRARQSAELEKLNQQLKAVNRDLEHFAYIASHDLKEPLNRITNYTGMLAERIGPEHVTAIEDVLAGLERCARRSTKLLDELRMLSRIQGSNLERERTDIGELVQEILKEQHPVIEKLGVQIKIDSLPVLNVYGNLIHALYRNLVENALRHAGTKQMQLSFTTEQRQGEICLGVKNSGSYIPKEKLEDIFLPFVKLTNHPQSTGIGLAFCRRIVEKHGGRIWAESADNSVYFRFTLSSSALMSSVN